jgi:hypothetical protein
MRAQILAALGMRLTPGPSRRRRSQRASAEGHQTTYFDAFGRRWAAELDQRRTASMMVTAVGVTSGDSTSMRMVMSERYSDIASGLPPQIGFCGDVAR